jgi:hypothetical protein
MVQLGRKSMNESAKIIAKPGEKPKLSNFKRSMPLCHNLYFPKVHFNALFAYNMS